METYGFSKRDRMDIVSNIERWMKTLPENFDWRNIAEVTDKNIHDWKQGDIVDIQEDHIKVFIDREYTKTNAKKKGNFYKHSHSGGFIMYKCKYFPDPENELILHGDNWKMTIVSYDGALRIYWRLTGKKLEGFEDFGRDVYYN